MCSTRVQKSQRKVVLIATGGELGIAYAAKARWPPRAWACAWSTCPVGSVCGTERRMLMKCC
ncbi:MAG: hypothetical protein R3A44_12735 [Caldilineaceae bacterium]